MRREHVFLLVNHECIHLQHVTSINLCHTLYKPVYLQSCTYVPEALSQQNLSEISQCIYISVLISTTEQNSLFVWFLALPVGPRLPTYRLHIHSAVSTRTAELSVN